MRVHGFSPARDLLKLNKQDGAPAWNLDKALKEIASSDRGVLVWIGQRHLQDLGPALETLTAPKMLNPMRHCLSSIKPLVWAHKFYVI